MFVFALNVESAKLYYFLCVYIIQDNCDPRVNYNNSSIHLFLFCDSTSTVVMLTSTLSDIIRAGLSV